MDPLRAAALKTMLAVALLSGAMTLSPASASEPLSIRIVGNHFVDGSGQPVRLLGINRSGTEYECMDGKGFFDGPADQDSIAAMAAWHINAVRVPLNEDCWLGINGAPAGLSGTAYREAISSYVRRLHDAGLYAIVDLHWSAPGAQPANSTSGQGRQMADRDHAPDFWRSVAASFKDDPATVLDLYNEPHDVSWDCWQNGCQTGDASGRWETAGFQSLIDAVRGSGARNPILVAGLRWSGDLRGWPHGLRDPAQQMAASWHVYTPTSRLDALRDFVVRPIAASYPVVIAELGEKDCGHAWLDGFLNWADSLGISYLAWTWDTWPDCGNPVLISSYNGTPTAYGTGFRDHLQALWRSHAAPRVLSPIEAFMPLIGAMLLVTAFVVALLFAAVFTLRRRRRRNAARTAMAM